jgi:hypothetical protein
MTDMAAGMPEGSAHSQDILYVVQTKNIFGQNLNRVPDEQILTQRFQAAGNAEHFVLFLGS